MDVKALAKLIMGKDKATGDLVERTARAGAQIAAIYLTVLQEAQRICDREGIAPPAGIVLIAGVTDGAAMACATMAEGVSPGCVARMRGYAELELPPVRLAQQREAEREIARARRAVVEGGCP